MKPRPSNKTTTGRILPVKPRAMQAGVLIYQPTAADKVKIAMGYAVSVHVQQVFQHNPGHIEVSVRWEVTEHQVMKDTPQVKALEKKGGGS